MPLNFQEEYLAKIAKLPEGEQEEYLVKYGFSSSNLLLAIISLVSKISDLDPNAKLEVESLVLASIDTQSAEMAKSGIKNSDLLGLIERLADKVQSLDSNISFPKR